MHLKYEISTQKIPAIPEKIPVGNRPRLFVIGYLGQVTGFWGQIYIKCRVVLGMNSVEGFLTIFENIGTDHKHRIGPLQICKSKCDGNHKMLPSVPIELLNPTPSHSVIAIIERWMLCSVIN
jgi:hypothetical protein